MGIISSLYNGGIFVGQERPEGEEYNRLTRECEKLKADFLATLSDGQKELYDQINYVRSEYIQMEMEQRFVTGFKMGAQFVKEINS